MKTKNLQPKKVEGSSCNQGVPHLNVEQHRRLLNILALDQGLRTITGLKEKIKSSDDLYKLYLKGNRIENQLKDLYKTSSPKEILFDMIEKSSNWYIFILAIKIYPKCNYSICLKKTNS